MQSQKQTKQPKYVVATDTSATGQVSFYDKLTPEQQSAITAKAPALVDNFVADQMLCLILEHLLLKKLTQPSTAFWLSKKT